MSVRIQVLFYSMYGHIYRMSEAIVEGAREGEPLVYLTAFQVK